MPEQQHPAVGRGKNEGGAAGAVVARAEQGRDRAAKVVVSAQLAGADELPPDDAAPRVIEVLENLPVLRDEVEELARGAEGDALDGPCD